MIKARASGSKVYLYFMKKGRQARHRIPRNSCFFIFIVFCIEILVTNMADPDQTPHSVAPEQVCTVCIIPQNGHLVYKW